MTGDVLGPPSDAVGPPIDAGEALIEAIDRLVEAAELLAVLVEQVQDPLLHDGVRAQQGLDVPDLTLEPGQAFVEGVALGRDALILDAQHLVPHAPDMANGDIWLARVRRCRRASSRLRARSEGGLHLHYPPRARRAPKIASTAPKPIAIPHVSSLKRAFISDRKSSMRALMSARRSSIRALTSSIR